MPPAPAPVAAQAPIDWAALGNTPELWPKTILLKAPVAFPAMLDGRVVGSMTAPAGAAVKAAYDPFRADSG